MSNRQTKYWSTPWPAFKPWMIGSLIFLLFSIVSLYIINQQYNIEKTREKRAAENVAESAVDRLQQSLQYSLSATQALEMSIDKNGIPGHFDSIASVILKNNKFIDALELIPGGVIKYIYPLKEQEGRLGYNILEDNSQNKEAVKAIEKGELFFAGPLESGQAGMSVIGRLPIIKNDKFWGFAAVVIKLPTLLKAAGIDTSGKSGYYFQLSKINPNTGKEEYFLPVRKIFPGEHKVAVSIPNGEWELSVVPANGYNSFEAVIPVCLLAFIVSVLASLFAAYISKTPARLQQLVLKRTTELEKSIADSKKSEKELIKSREDLRKLSNYIENIREEERLRISREIHDEIGQQLTILKMDIARLGKKATSADKTISPEINKVLESVNDIVQAVRKISFTLRPGLLDDIGLVAALDWYCADFSNKTGIEICFIPAVTDEKVPSQLNVGLFRILQESLSNVALHSGANQTEVSIKCHEKELVLSVEDNGKGFDSSMIDNNKTLGILGMKERAIMMGGTYKISSAPGKGTVIEVVIPFNQQAPETSSNL